jgi:GxxExxY protein
LQKDLGQKDNRKSEVSFVAPNPLRMPISTKLPLRRLSQAEFGDVSYQVLGHVFAIHGELGRFFEERIYKQELANRMAGVRLEEPIDITYGAYRKRLFIDVLVNDGAIFEFKAVEKLTTTHRAQLCQYLMLCELGHGKLINVRPESVEHEFVNSSWRRDQRCQFEIDDLSWSSSFSGSSEFRDWMVGLLRDLGTGLTISLYEEATMAPERLVRVTKDGQTLGETRVRLLTPDTAVKITAIAQNLAVFEGHARRWLAHVDVQALAWVNISMERVTFALIRK